MKPIEISVQYLTRLFKWFGVVLLVCGLGLAATGLLRLRDSIAAVRNGLEAEGRVVSLEYIGSARRGGSLYRPRVEFRTPDGSAHTLLVPEYTASRWYQRQWKAVKGQHVIVLYRSPRFGARADQTLLASLGKAGLAAARGVCDRGLWVRRLFDKGNPQGGARRRLTTRVWRSQSSVAWSSSAAC